MMHKYLYDISRAKLMVFVCMINIIFMDVLIFTRYKDVVGISIMLTMFLFHIAFSIMLTFTSTGINSRELMFDEAIFVYFLVCLGYWELNVLSGELVLMILLSFPILLLRIGPHEYNLIKYLIPCFMLMVVVICCTIFVVEADGGPIGNGYLYSFIFMYLVSNCILKIMSNNYINMLRCSEALIYKDICYTKYFWNKIKDNIDGYDKILIEVLNYSNIASCESDTTMKHIADCYTYKFVDTLNGWGELFRISRDVFVVLCPCSNSSYVKSYLHKSLVDNEVVVYDYIIELNVRFVK